MNDLVFCVDLDGTLKTDMDAVGPWEVESITIVSGPHQYTFAPRPNVKKFLEAAKSKGQVFLTTAAGGGYARRVVKALGIDQYFDRIIAAEEFNRGIPFLKNCIFIDNNPEMGLLKMDRMQKPSTIPTRQDLWSVDTFNGNSDDKTMLELVAEIENL